MSPAPKVRAARLALGLLVAAAALACCPAPRDRQSVVNGDQTVLMIWDAETKTQHFIRAATFQNQGADFGFIVPTPTQPELAEADPGVFNPLRLATRPRVIEQPVDWRDRLHLVSVGCGAPMVTSAAGEKAPVRVLDEKRVAGYDATVLEADSAAALRDWLKANDYAFSPAVVAWAEPYVAKKWKFTALKVAASSTADRPAAGPTRVGAKCLRLSFKTDAPLFPYREPDPRAMAKELGVTHRSLRIYFVAETRYEGVLSGGEWTGRAGWSNALDAATKAAVTKAAGLPADAGPAAWWLTEFIDNWPYAVAPSDLTFRPRSAETLEYPPVVVEVETWASRNAPGAVTALVLAAPFAAAGAGVLLWRRVRRT